MSTSKDELVTKVDRILDVTPFRYLKARICGLVATEVLKELKELALDNYRGQTFSDSTNWEGKYDKFIKGLERRIAFYESKVGK